MHQLDEQGNYSSGHDLSRKIQAARRVYSQEGNTDKLQTMDDKKDAVKEERSSGLEASTVWDQYHLCNINKTETERLALYLVAPGEEILEIT